MKHPEIDHYYHQRINHICDNIKFLKDYRDIQELMVVKKTYSLGKLLQNHHAFKDDMIALDKKIKERKQLVKELSRAKAL